MKIIPAFLAASAFSAGVKSKRFWRAGQISLGAVVMLLFLMRAGEQARNKLKLKYPPPGRLFDIGGTRFHLNCQGEGSPTVILEAGFSSLSLVWFHIQAEVAWFTRVCTYDRAGYGWSEPSPRPRTAQVIVEELHALLNQANIPGPYVLVGNSLGGLFVRLYAYEHPENTAGMVLIDATHEEQFQRLSGVSNPLMRPIFRILKSVVVSGIPALTPNLVPIPPKMPAEAGKAYQALAVSDARYIETTSAEYELLEESLAQVRAAGIKTLGDIPLIVLSHGKQDGFAARSGIISAEKQREAEQVWLELQSELAALSTNGRLIVAHDSGHNIEFEQSGMVIDAIRQVVENVRAKL